MYTAREVGSGQIVFASKAKTYRNYVCPVCKADVFLRVGHYRDAHFAHKSGMGSKDCALYHPSFAIQAPISSPSSGWAADPDFKIRPKYLSIEIDKEQGAGSAPRNWNLHLTLPQAPTDKGLIHVELGNQRRKIPLSKLFLSEQAYPVTAGAGDFKAVWRSPEVPDDYFEAVSDSLKLPENVATAFDASPLKHKPLTRRLVWGEYYYFIWPSITRFTLPDEFSALLLAKKDGWACALIQLPEQEDEDLAKWIQSFCGLVPESQARRWAIVHPAPRRRNIFGEISVSALDNLVLGYFQPTNDEWTIGVVANGEEHSIELQNGGWHIFEHRPDGGPRCNRLQLRSDGQELAALVGEEQKSLPIASVRISFRDRTSGQITIHHLHHEKSLAELERVRYGRSEIAEVQLPKHLLGQIRSRNCKTGAYSEEELVSSELRDERDRSVLLDVASVKAINSGLAAEETEVSLDFGHFGIATFPPFSQARERFHNLSPTLRKKILWLCSQSNSCGRRDGLTLNRLSNTALIEHFRMAKVGPAWVAHARAINHLLAQHGDVQLGGSHK